MQTTTTPGPRPRRASRRIEFRCWGCGYGARAGIAPLRCPMCGGSTWEEPRPRAHPPHQF